MKLTFENEYKAMKAVVNSQQKEIERFRAENAFLAEKLADTENRFANQVTNLTVKGNSNTHTVKEYENKLEELTEERENWRDLLYQEKQSHMQTKEKCELNSRTIT